MRNEKILSSLPLQVLLYFNEKYTWLWFFLNLTIFCWKSYNLYYMRSAICWEVTLVFLLPILDLCRNTVATRGNKTEQFVPLIWSACLAAPTVLGYVFFFELQTYVLHVDKWLNAISLAFISSELALSFFALIVFRRAYP
mmetsp:Transcript_18126/g.37869  ORF Transcript_18126/g.37869 Transcript_18126/m.37869 type:complete len:140 (+) Transcript_18126:182-601(+)